MKKIFVGLVLMVGVLFLSGCDMFDNGINDIWYDNQNETLHLSYSLPGPEENDDGQEVPEFYFLVAKDNSTVEWYDVLELDSHKAKDLELQVRFKDYGDVELKIEKRTSDGTVFDQSEVMNFYIEQPQYIYHFDTWFDSWNGGVQFNFGINEQVVKSFSIEKSKDGGITWEEVLNQEVEIKEDGVAKSNIVYYEYEEGNYVFKMIAFDENNDQIQTMNTWGEINIQYQDKVYEGNPEVYYVGSSFNLYDRNVNIWWDAQGAFDEALIEKSTDQETWEYVGDVPRFAHSFNYYEEVDGDYHYRVSAVLEDEVKSSSTTEESLRVKEGILIGHFDGWVDYESQQVQLNWDFVSEDNLSVVLERSHNGEDYEVAGEFGALKKMFTDNEVLPGEIVYRLSIVDEEGNVKDQLESKTFKIEQPQHVYHINAWFNNSTGEIEFQFGINQNYVSKVIVYKSEDGGLTWSEFATKDIEFTEHNWYKDHFREYELVEGSYAYKIEGYDSDDKFMGEAHSWNEVIVEYHNLNLDEPTEIYHLDGNYNIYDNSVNLWWNGQGNFEYYSIEYSTDEIIWTVLKDVPRVATFTQVYDLADGEYYFRINAMDNEDNVVYTKASDKNVRVKENAQIGSIHMHSDYNDTVKVYWDILKDDVAVIKLERRVASDTTYTLLGEFGSLKTTFLDNVPMTETYVYKLTLIDSEGNELDSMESYEYHIELNE